MPGVNSSQFSCYVSLTAQCLSKDGVYLCIGRSDGAGSGTIAVYKVLDVLDHRVTEHVVFPLASGQPVTALAATTQELIVGKRTSF